MYGVSSEGGVPSCGCCDDDAAAVVDDVVEGSSSCDGDVFEGEGPFFLGCVIGRWDRIRVTVSVA